MPSSSAQHEPTMEEIVASIRKIISEDANEVQSSPPVHQEAQVLELTHEVEEEPELPPVVSEPSDVEREFQAENSGASEPVASGDCGGTYCSGGRERNPNAPKRGKQREQFRTSVA